SPLEGLRAAVPASVEVVHEPGCVPSVSMPRLDVRRCEGGIVIDYFANRGVEGEAVASHVSVRPTLVWLGATAPAPELTAGDWSARMRARYTPATSGDHVLELRTTGAVRVALDGKELLRAEA